MTNNFKLPKNVTQKELEEKSDMFASFFLFSMTADYLTWEL